MTDLGWVDVTLLVVLTTSVLLGFWRGLVFELMSLVGWVVAYVAAQALSPQVGPHVPIGAPDTALHQGATFAVTFIVVLVGWALLSRLVRLVVRATPLTWIDRVLGGIFGLVRGGVLLLVLATVVAFTPAVRSPQWVESRGAAWLAVALQGIKPMLPAEVVRHLPG